MALLGEKKKTMRNVIRLFGRIHILIYRLTSGKIGGKMLGSNTLLLTTTGRKSGRQRTSPMMFLRQDDAYMVAASNNGKDTHPGWYWNLRSNPQATIEVMEKKMQVEAELVSEGDRRERLYQQFIELTDVYEGHQQRTDRIIPVVLLRLRS